MATRLGYSNPSPTLHSRVTYNRQTGPGYALLSNPGPSHPAGSTLGPFWSFPRCVCSSVTRDISVKCSLLGSTHRGQGFGPLVASRSCCTMASGTHLPLKHGRGPLQAPCLSVAAVYFAIHPPGENLWYLNKFSFVFCYCTSMFSYYAMQKDEHLSFWSLCQKRGAAPPTVRYLCPEGPAVGRSTRHSLTKYFCGPTMCRAQLCPI